MKKINKLNVLNICWWTSNIFYSIFIGDFIITKFQHPSSLKWACIWGIISAILLFFYTEALRAIEKEKERKRIRQKAIAEAQYNQARHERLQEEVFAYLSK